MTLFTIGYEGVSLGAFIELLRANRIEHLVDVREAPISRKRGFARSTLSAAVRAAGISYSHIQALGCPKAVRDRFKAEGDWSRYTRDFKRHLALQGHALDELGAITRLARTCLMCYEADFNRCHRTYVAEAVTGSGGELRHIVQSDDAES